MPGRARRAGAEGIGTFFLVLIGPGTAMVDAHTHGMVGHVGVALAFAFVVVAMVYALGHLSGAHINPAVTLAFWSVRRFPASEVTPLCGGAVRRRCGCWVAPITGMMVAARTYETLRLVEPLPATPGIVPVGIQGPIQPS